MLDTAAGTKSFPNFGINKVYLSIYLLKRSAFYWISEGNNSTSCPFAITKYNSDVLQSAGSEIQNLNCTIP